MELLEARINVKEYIIPGSFKPISNHHAMFTLMEYLLQELSIT